MTNENNTPQAQMRGSDLPIWANGGIAYRLLAALDEYRKEYVFSPDEGSDHEPTEFEAVMIEDFLNGSMSCEPVNRILQDAAKAAMGRAFDVQSWAEGKGKWNGDKWVPDAPTAPGSNITPRLLREKADFAEELGYRDHANTLRDAADTIAALTAKGAHQ